MSSRIQSMTEQAKPWSRTVPPWLVLIEGILVLAVGLYIFVDAGQSATWLLGLLGAVLLINSALHLYSEWYRQTPADRQTVQLVRGGIGLVVGLLIVLQLFTPFLPAMAAMTILALGLAVVALIGFYNVIRSYSERGVAWGSALANLIYLAFAGLLFYAMRNEAGESVMQVFGGIFTVAGALLFLYAFILRRRRENVVESAPAAPAQPASAPPQEPVATPAPVTQDTQPAAPAVDDTPAPPADASPDDEPGSA